MARDSAESIKPYSTVDTAAQSDTRTDHMEENRGDEGEDGTIAAFGYAPVYRRVLGSLVGFCIVVALSSPLGAIMISGYYPVTFAGYWGLSWGWIIPNVMLVPQVIAVAELCSSMPVNGGFYWWAAALAPERYARAAGFIVGWFNVLALATGLAAFAYAVASGFAQSLYYATDGGYVPTLAELMGMSMGVITVWALLLLLRLERVSIVMVTTAAVLLLSSVGFVIGLPIAHAQKGFPFATAGQVFGSFSNVSEWPETAIAVPFSFYCALFVNSIWVAPAYLAEETHDAANKSPRAIVEAFACTALFGTGISLAFAFCIHDMDTIAKDPTGYPLFTVLYEHWGQRSTAIFLVIGSIFSLVGGSGMLLTYATQVAAFARDGGLPYSTWLSRVHRRTNMPLFATALLVALTYLFLLPALSQNASDIVYSMASLASLIIWAVPVALRLFAGDRWVPGPFYTGRLSWTIHLLGVLSSAYFLITRSFPPTKDTPPVNVAVVIMTFVASVGAYFFCSHGFRGLDLVALEAWRLHSRHTPDVRLGFADVVRQSTADAILS